MKLIVPTSLNDISWRQFRNYTKVSKAVDFTESLNRLAMVSIFCKIPARECAKVPSSDIKDISEHIEKVLALKPAFTELFEMGGKEYGFIPNLDEMTAGEYIDLDTYFGDEENFHKALSVLYRPVKKKKFGMYFIEKYEGSDKYADIMMDANLNIALGSTVFFWSLRSALLKATGKYLERPEMKEALANLPQNGAGIPQSIRSLVDGLSNMTQLPEPAFIHSYPNWNF